MQLQCFYKVASRLTKFTHHLYLWNLLFTVEEHENRLQEAKVRHLQQLEEVKGARESSGFV